MKRRGFTLIELLVVIAIIAILAAILFPVFTRAREAGRRAACTSNLRQVALAIAMYRDDYDSFPASGQYPGPVSGPYSFARYGFGFWIGMITPYLKTDAIYRCPSARSDLPDRWTYPDVRVATYGYNEYFAYTQAFSSSRGQTGTYWDKELKCPSLTALVADNWAWTTFHDWGWLENIHSDPADGDGIPLPSGMMRVKYANGNRGGRLSTRHDGANIIFCDLHVDFVHLKEFAAPYWPFDAPLSQRRQHPLFNPGATPL